MLLRAVGRSHDGFDNVSWRGQALPAGKARKCVLLHMSEYSDVVSGARQHLVVPLGRSTSTWREAILERMIMLNVELAPHVASMVCLVNGRVLPEDHDVNELADVTVRCRSGGLAGGAPKARDFANMKKSELMDAAKALGVDTRRRGLESKKMTWRPMPEVVTDCERAVADSDHSGAAAGNWQAEETSSRTLSSADLNAGREAEQVTQGVSSGREGASSDARLNIGSQASSSALANVGGQALLATQQEAGLFHFWGKPTADPASIPDAVPAETLSRQGSHHRIVAKPM